MDEKKDDHNIKLTKRIRHKCKKIQETNVIREVSNYINDNTNLDRFKGHVYVIIHNILIFVISFVVIFNTSVIQLCVILFILSLDAFSIVVLHECPLTILEKKYLGVSGCDMRNVILKNLKIRYNCDHNYEKQIELLINIWSIVACKIIIIMFLNGFNIKLKNFNDLYT